MYYGFEGHLELMILLFILYRAMLIIHDRIEYLSRAVMCAKSCGMLTSGSEEGEVLHEIEEKLEVDFKETFRTVLNM